MSDYYDFKDRPADVRSIIALINLQGKDLVGAEIGVFEAESFLTLLQNCPNIKTLHGVDSYQPHKDYLYKGTAPSREPAHVWGQKEIEIIKALSYHRQKYSGHQEKIVFHEEDSNIAAKSFENESLDFIFLDAHLTYEHTCNDLEVWYPKVKKGGIFAGHDLVSVDVQMAVDQFREKRRIHSLMSTYDNTWVWYK